MVVCALLPANARAVSNQLFEEFGVGPRDVAMGSAGVALGVDYSAVYYNPAGLAFQDGNHIALGWKAIYKELYLELDSYPGRNFARSYPDMGQFLLGMTTDFDFEGRFHSFLTERLAIGLVLSIGEYLKTFNIYGDPTTPHMFRYDVRNAALLPLFFCASFKIFDSLAFGMGGVVAPSDTYTDVTAKTEIRVADQSFETNQSIISRTFSKVKPQIGFIGRAPGFGRADTWRFGFTWRDEVSTVDGSGAIRTVTRVVDDNGNTVMELPKTEGPLLSATGFSPMSVTTAVALLLPHNTAQADVIWQRWSQYRDQTESYPEPRFHDTWQVRFGYEHAFDLTVDWADRLMLRGGYYYQPTPVPDQSGPGNLLDSNKHVMSSGMGLEFTDPLGIVLLPMSVDFAYQIHALEDRVTENDRDPDWSRMRHGGFIHQAVFAASIQF